MAMGFVTMLALTGCGTDDPTLSPACIDDPAAVQVALSGAPGHVALRDGTTLSRCISAATDEADLQNVGSVFFTVAEKLSESARGGNPVAALQLGYLIGATHRGASKTNGVLAELERRVALVGSRLAERFPKERAAVDRGRAAGEAGG